MSFARRQWLPMQLNESHTVKQFELFPTTLVKNTFNYAFASNKQVYSIGNYRLQFQSILVSL